MKLRDKIDELGKVKAKLSKLNARENELIDEIKRLGPGVRSGKLFEANTFRQTRAYVDWERVVKDAKVPARVVRKHTHEKPILVLTVGARRIRRASKPSSRTVSL